MRIKTTVPAVALAAGLALSAQAPAQTPPPTTTVTGTVKVAPKVSRAKLLEGLPVTIGCSAACSGSVTLAGPTGVITSKSAPLRAAGTRTVRLKAWAFQVKALRKGAKLYLTLNEGGSMSPALAQDTTRLK